MKKILNPITATIAFALSSTAAMAQQGDLNLDVIAKSDTGRPSFVKGDLGVATPESATKALKNIVANEARFKANGNEDFIVKRQWIDQLGKQHTQMTQTINGLKVYGTDMTVHTDAVDKFGAKSNKIYAVSGRLAINGDSLDRSSIGTSMRAVAAARNIGDIVDAPELAYIFDQVTGKTSLSWKIEVTYVDNGDFSHDILFFDAHSTKLITRHARVHSAKNWKTYDHQNQSYSTAPTKLLCSNTQSCGDSSAQRAHDGASSVYDFYKNRFGRNGVNGSDMTTISSVHVETNLNNAFWYSNRMMYGDGDGSQFYDLTLAHDVIGHELTHGVTEYTAGLIYQNASGALNEAWSDILGVSAESYKKGNTQPDWKLGEEVMVSGGALRYMNNPTADGYSKDWYPERIPFTSSPSNSNDQGGVHGNSGIANLAFQLVVDGGTHPRGKSTANVPSIGLAKAEQIFYRALATYMGQSTDFAGARTATAQAAQDLYGATEKTAVETAWCAVGVGTCPGDTPTGGNALTNGVAKTGISASTGGDVVFTLDVPAGATNISFNMSGGTGDADMYVKFGATPTDSSYDCRPYKSGNTESCTGTQTGGTYYVRLKAYSSFSGVSLTGSYTAASSGPSPIDSTVNSVAVSKSAWKRYTLDLGTGYTSLVVTMSGGTGDADLYTRHGAQSTSTAYDCRPYKSGNNETCTHNSPASGTWYIDLYGYSAASGITLNVKAN